jgi:hypothetical protein
MSGVAIIRYLLVDDPLLTQTVPAGRIKAGVMPINTQLPAISITQVSGIEYSVIKRGENQLVIERIQITVLATTYPDQKNVLKLVRAALLNGACGDVNGFDVDSITYESDGPDLYSDNPVIFEQSVDYIVRFIM